jgi:peptide/nickel transport system substrate-binding protein
MPYLNPEVDRLIEAAEQEFDLGKHNQLLAQVHETIVEDAPWVCIVHDLNPRALSPKVKGFVHPQSWFVDLTLPWVEKSYPRASERCWTLSGRRHTSHGTKVT